MNLRWSQTMFLVMCLVMLTIAVPARRSQDMEARRRSAIDRSLIRFGRSYPSQISAADIREAFERPSSRSTSFLRFGRSQPLNIPSEDLYSLLKSYQDDHDSSPKRHASFLRFGRDPSFIRLGRSGNDGRTNEETSDLIFNGNPERKSRARDHFLRLGRNNDDLMNEDFEEEERRKRSTETECHDCQS